MVCVALGAFGTDDAFGPASNQRIELVAQCISDASAGCWLRCSQLVAGLPNPRIFPGPGSALTQRAEGARPASRLRGFSSDLAGRTKHLIRSHAGLGRLACALHRKALRFLPDSRSRGRRHRSGLGFRRSPGFAVRQPARCTADISRLHRVIVQAAASLVPSRAPRPWEAPRGSLTSSLRAAGAACYWLSSLMRGS